MVEIRLKQTEEDDRLATAEMEICERQLRRPMKESPRPKRIEPRLVIPAVSDRQAADTRLKALIDNWIVPRLVQEFLREHAGGQEPPGRQES
jgi:hypothetical protein